MTPLHITALILAIGGAWVILETLTDAIAQHIRRNRQVNQQQDQV